MFKHTLIGVQDVASGGEGLVAARAVTPDAQLTLVRVYRGLEESMTGMGGPRASAERHLAESDLKRAAQLAGVTDTLCLSARTTAGGLASALHSRDGDLLVLSASQILGARENLLDSLDLFDVPIVISSSFPSSDTGPIRRIGIVHDGTTESGRVLRFARHTAAARSAALIGFDIRAYQSLDAAQASVRVALEISTFGQSLDLLVIGSRHTRLRRRLLGFDTIEQVIAASFTPVMLVPSQVRPRQLAGSPPSEDWISAQRTATGPGRHLA